MSSNPLKGRSASEQLYDRILGFRTSQMISVAARLGIADLLRDGSKGVEELADATETHAPSLYRLLRGLASMGIFVEDDARRFRLSPMAELLRSDVPGSLQRMAFLPAEPSFWQPWGELMHSVRTGETAFGKVFGMNVWDYRARDAEANRTFNEAMTSNSQMQIASILEAYDFSRLRHLVDVGGGQGALLAGILRANPSLSGTLFDQPHAVAGARQLLGDAGVAERCRIVGGDMFRSVPKEADAYVLKLVIHDLPDDEAIALLQNCRRSMPRGATILVIDRVVPFGGGRRVKLGDLQMLVVSGGRERTAAEFARLYDAAGLVLARIVPTSSPLSVLEGVKPCA